MARWRSRKASHASTTFLHQQEPIGADGGLLRSPLWRPKCKMASAFCQVPHPQPNWVCDLLRLPLRQPKCSVRRKHCHKTGGLAALGSGQGGPAPKANMLGLADAENLIFTANCNRDIVSNITYNEFGQTENVHSRKWSSNQIYL